MSDPLEYIVLQKRVNELVEKLRRLEEKVEDGFEEINKRLQEQGQAIAWAVDGEADGGS